VAHGGSFATRVIAWQQHHGRHDLPWQASRDPYRIWLSEIMLQQTQVATVLPYFARFVAAFPSVHDLAQAHVDQVLGLWSGLGYYARARNLHSTACAIAAAGRYPRSASEWAELPGVGRSTAAAIAVFAFGAHEAILDGNVKRVLARHFLIEGFPGDKKTESALWSLAESLVPKSEVEAYTQGLMDLGATVCTRSKPHCQACPLATTCGAHRECRVDELPSPRPKRHRPHKSVTLLVLVQGSKVMLEKRPPSGIWGGLWSLPEAGSARSALAICRARTGCEPTAVRELTPVEHGFTHFSLAITPCLFRLPALPLQITEPGVGWFELAELATLGLPAPIRKILTSSIGSGLL
jgi:A/G-specific adenine glycosylase